MIPKITLTAFLLASTLGICPMQLKISVMDHSQMNMDTEGDMPCADCYSASENFVLKDAQVFNVEIPIFVAASIPVISDADEFTNNLNNSPLFTREGPSLHGPPLIGTVILRT